jgi:hypothetical protein
LVKLPVTEEEARQAPVSLLKELLIKRAEGRASAEERLALSLLAKVHYDIQIKEKK